MIKKAKRFALTFAKLFVCEILFFDILLQDRAVLNLQGYTLNLTNSSLMKLKKLFSTLLLTSMLCASMNLHAQVRIGSAHTPQPGAVLDLNAKPTNGHIGGLLLPNVEITDLGKIPNNFTKESVRGECVVPELAGLIVYNTNLKAAANIFRGTYVWDGDNWHLLAIDGGMMSIDYDTNRFLGCDDRLSTGPVQISNSGLDIAGIYTFTVIAGSEFASVSAINEEQGIFSVEFQPNTTAIDRRCVVLVTDPAGRTATFIFTQERCPCADEIPVTVSVYGTNQLCQGGSVHAFVVNADPKVSYFWVRNGIEVAQGAGVELTQIGTYRVYAGMIGCGTPGVIEVVASDNRASRVPHIIVDNNGILCGTNGVRLTALNAPTNPDGLIWLKDGLEQARDVSFFDVPHGIDSQGIWYLIYTTSDGCSSVSSNKITLVYAGGSSALPMPDARVNGVVFSSNELVVCAGGTLELTIANASAYSGFNNVMYEWFGNGISLGRTTSPTMFVVPPTYTHLVLSVTVTASGECPKSQTSDEFTVRTQQTPLPTSINRGANRAYICATNPAVLSTGANPTFAHQWFRNGVEMVGISDYQISVMQPGAYTVRYKNTHGCWSMVSTPIEVIQSAPVTISWISQPATEEIFESSKTYSVSVAPNADTIEWSVENPAHASFVSIVPFGVGTAAIVNFGTNSTEVSDVQIRVRASNTCGTSELLSSKFTVKEGCIPAGSVVITPNTQQTVREGESIAFTVSANTGSDPMTFSWYVNDVEQVGQTGSSFVFSTTDPERLAGNYRVVARVQNNCTNPPGTASAIVPVIVTLDPSRLPQHPNRDAVQPHFHSGKTCLDVHVTNGNASDNPWADGGRLPLAMRPNDFNNGNQMTFTYTFSTIGGSNIRFMLDDPQNLIQSVSCNANSNTATATVTFSPSIQTKAAQTTRNTALEFTLYAVYSHGGQDYQENITIRVQDQACGCPARVSATQWQMFACHNAGADVTRNPFDLSSGVALQGHWYAWGRKLPGRLRGNVEVPAADRPSSTRPATLAWSTWENPCEPGWTVPSRTVLQNLHSHNARRISGTSLNRFWHFGEYVILPPQGYTGGTTSIIFTSIAVNNGGHHYWTATGSSDTHAFNMFRHSAVNTTTGNREGEGPWSKNFLEAVRCVQEGTPFAEND